MMHFIDETYETSEMSKIQNPIPLHAANEKWACNKERDWGGGGIGVGRNVWYGSPSW